MATSTLDTAVAEAVYTAHLLERALHGRDRWSIRVGDRNLDTVRRVKEEGVVFEATWNVCLREVPVEMHLVCEGEIVRTREIEGRESFAPGDKVEFTWLLAPRAPERV